MKFNTFVTSENDLQACSAAPGLEEVLIEIKYLAREGRLDVSQATSLALQAKILGLKAVLVWDILMTQSQFKSSCAILRNTDLNAFQAVRVQCPGAALWIRKEFPDKNLHFIVENSNHNLPALRRWQKELNVNRMVLSVQLTEEKLVSYCQQLESQCEVLGAGKLLLFYSPRSLLSPNFSVAEGSLIQPWIYADSLSEESLLRPFPTIENQHGTFMYLNKDHFILHKLDKLASAGMHTIRIDLRSFMPQEDSASGIAELCRKTVAQEADLAESWPRPAFAPFFKTNKTDKQFGRLKSQTRAFRDLNCLAEVVSTERGKLLGFYALQDFSTDIHDLKIVLPDGNIVPYQSDSFYNLQGQRLNFCAANQLLTGSWLKKVRTGSLLIRQRED